MATFLFEMKQKNFLMTRNLIHFLLMMW